VANLHGQDKLPLEERVAWTDAAVADGSIFRTADEPLGPHKDWWLQAEAPVQFFAACVELTAALRRKGPPELHISHAPIHQDGSCNGLQHYAALGRDSYGGQQVNLTPSDRPQDVYAGVRALVEAKVAKDAADPESPHFELARQLDGRISRKVVKQTVMTSVYGVTFVGARQQIQNRLEEVTDLEELPRAEHHRLASYVAKLTLASLGEVFTGATTSMTWLASCARAISREGDAPVEWVTPLGLPVLQPYSKRSSRRIKTVLQSILLCDSSDAECGVDSRKQTSAFPPNYVHSLDSSHMLMTASACRKAGITFAAVHDSYWTHPCDVDRMNAILRRQFILLHQQPLLEQLLASFRKRYSCKHEGGCDLRQAGGACAEGGCDCHAVRWDEHEELRLPEQGDLNLEEVSKSTYFFA